MLQWSLHPQHLPYQFRHWVDCCATVKQCRLRTQLPPECPSSESVVMPRHDHVQTGDFVSGLHPAQPHGRSDDLWCIAPQRPASELAREHLYLACAMIRGALCHLGVDCIVSADAAALPACDFTIVTKAQTA